MGLAFEWTVRAGDIGTFIGAICVAAAFLYRRGGDDVTVKLTLKVMAEQLVEMKKELTEFRQAMTKMAVQDERMNSMSARLNRIDARYDEIRRGEGLIVQP